MGSGGSKPRYRGATANGVPEGQGRMVWSDGRKYEGGFSKGLMHGFGAMKMPNGDTYDGEWRDGSRHGQGVFNFAEGSYNGLWAKGLMDGDGVLTLNVGTTYNGGFKKHKYDGKGVLKLAGGEKYTGTFRNGLYDGQGFLKMADGSMYDGGFKNGDVHGRGRWFSPGNWLYDGMFEQGIPFEGEMTNFDGKVYFVTYDVSSKHNELGFKGEQVKPSEETLIGKYVAGWDGNRDCTGTVRFEWADGRVFQGELIDGCPTKGKLVDIEKTLWDVEYDGKTLITQEHLKPIRQTLSAVEVEKDRMFFMQMERIEKRIAKEEESFEEMRKMIAEELQGDQFPVRAKDKENMAPLSSDDPNVATDDGLEEAKSQSAADPDTDVKSSTTPDIVNEIAPDTRPPSVQSSEATRSPPPPHLPVKEDSGAGRSAVEESKSKDGVATVQDEPKPERVKSNLMKRVETAKPLIDRVEAREREKLDQQKPTWKSQAKAPNWYPQMEGFGSFTGQLDLGAAMEYRKQLQAKTNADVREQERKESRGRDVSTRGRDGPEEDEAVAYQFPPLDQLQSRIAELVAMLYSGEERRGDAAPAVTLHGDETLGRKKVVLQEMQEQAARELLWMLGGQVKGSLDHEKWWTTVDEKLIKTENRKRVDLTARYLNMDGGMKALVHVLRSERCDEDLATAFKASKEIDKPPLILGYGPRSVDVREIAAQCVAIGSVINLNNGVKLRMKTHPHRPEGDGVYALVDLLGRGPDGVRERAADSLARLCAASTTLRTDAVSYKGVIAIMNFFSEGFSSAFRLKQSRILVDMAEARKLRASAAASEEMQDNLMRMAQEELEERLVVVKALEFRLKRMRETAFVALCALTEDSPDAGLDVLDNGGVPLLVTALNDSSLSWRAIEAAAGALSNVCRSLLGVDQEQDDPAQRSQKLDASTREEANGAGWQGADLDTSRQRSADVGRGARERLLQEMEARTGVAALCGLLARTKDDDERLLVSTRTLAALTALMKDNEQVGATVFAKNGVELFLDMFKYGQDASKWYLKKSAIPVQVPYVTKEALKARETAVGALGALMKVSSLAVDTMVAMHGVPRLIQLLSLGDEMSFEDSTPTLATEALYQAMKVSQKCITEARRCAIREVIASLKASPLLRSPNQQQRQQAEWVAHAAEHLTTLLNAQPQEGEGFAAHGVGFDMAVKDVLRIQAMWKRARARIRARDLGRLSGPTRASILRLEEARDNEAQFKTFCSTKTIPGRSAASGGQSMNSFEFIDLLRHISVFGKDSSDRHKISKTQAIIAFKNASQAGESGRSRPRNAAAELRFSDFQSCIRSCIRILLSAEEVDMRGTIFEQHVPQTTKSAALAHDASLREAERRVNPAKSLVGTKSVLNFLMHPSNPAQ